MSKNKRSRPGRRTSKPKTRQKDVSGRTAISKPADEAKQPVTAPPGLSDGLTPAQLVFCLDYLENGFNATAAYRKAHPNTTAGTASSEGWRTLRIPKVAAFLGRRLEEVWKPLQMGGEQALGLVGMLATGRDDEGERIKIRDQLLALRIVLEATKKIAGLAGGIDELAAAIRADTEAHKEAMQR